MKDRRYITVSAFSFSFSKNRRRFRVLCQTIALVHKRYLNPGGVTHTVLTCNRQNKRKTLSMRSSSSDSADAAIMYRSDSRTNSSRADDEIFITCEQFIRLVGHRSSLRDSGDRVWILISYTSPTYR